MNNYLGATIDITEGKATYDHQAKLILSNVHILAWILKYTITDFREWDIDAIIACINEDSREVASAPIHGKLPIRKSVVDKVQGLSQESFGADEGAITFDIRFEIFVGEASFDNDLTSMGTGKAMVDLEAQKEYFAGYNIITRGFVYDARMISEQVTGITTDNYDLIENVYSIWICTNVPKYMENTITKYNIQRHDLYGTVNTEYREDLMCVVTICLGSNINQGTELHQMLATALSDTLSAAEKKRLLEEKFHIPVSREMEKELSVMCNLSDLIEERGISKGITQGREEGERNLAELIEKLLAAGRMADVQLAVKDEMTRNCLYKEFGIQIK